MDVYMRFVIVLNFLVNFLLILGTNRISGYPFRMKRAACGAMVGAAYVACVIYCGFDAGAAFAGYMIAMILSALAAFGCKRDAFRRSGIFLCFTLTVGTIAWAAGRGSVSGMLFGSLAISVFLFVLSPQKQKFQHYVSVQIEHRGKSAFVTALLDTGNTLRDPISGHPVIVVDSVVAEQLLNLSPHQLAHPVETLISGDYPGLRIIPYTTIGLPAGMMLGLRVDRLLVNGKQDQMIVAFAPQKIGMGRPYQALVGGVAV